MIVWFVYSELYICMKSYSIYIVVTTIVGLYQVSFLPEFLPAVLSCCLSVRQVAAEGRVESIIFRYCSLA